MLKKLATRFAVLVVAVLPFVGQPLTAAASSGGTLFAITGTNQNFLSRVDPSTGVVSHIEDLAGPNQNLQAVNLAGDPATHRLFVIRSDGLNNEVLTIDSTSGNILADKPVNAQVDQIGFDSSTGTLWLLGFSGISTLDPATGLTTVVVGLGNTCCGILSMAVVPGAHTIYVNNFDPGLPASDQILTVDTSARTVMSSPVVEAAVRIISYDTGNGGLFGLRDCCPRQLVKVDPANATDTVVDSFTNDPSTINTFAMAVDPSTDTVFADAQTSTQDQVVSMSDQGPALIISPPTTETVWSMYFETPATVITPGSIIADVKSALSSGAITNAGVASSLLAKLNAAKAARGRGQCATAALIYHAFIAEVRAQSGKAIAPATAGRLVSEAQFLIANCP